MLILYLQRKQLIYLFSIEYTIKISISYFFCTIETFSRVRRLIIKFIAIDQQGVLILSNCTYDPTFPIDAFNPLDKSSMSIHAYATF